jgi:hypothetical protein
LVAVAAPGRGRESSESDASGVRPAFPAEECLDEARRARSSLKKEHWARRGLEAKGPIDPEIRALLLHQLFNALFAEGQFVEAERTAYAGATLPGAESLSDVLFHHASRAAMAQLTESTPDNFPISPGRAAIEYARFAVDAAPTARRPFQLWTLGSLLFLAHDYPGAITALRAAAEAEGHPLYRAHLVLVQVASGCSPSNDEIQAAVNDLAQDPSREGYGRFVLGHLAYAAGEFAVAGRHLTSFLQGAHKDAALSGEVALAKTTLEKLA